MKRLTKRVGTGEAVLVSDFDICKPFEKSGECKTGIHGRYYGHWERHCNDECILGMLIDRLAEYEDTNLTPNEIEAIWNIYKRLDIQDGDFGGDSYDD